MVKSYNLLLNATAQRLSQVYPSGANNAQPSTAEDIPFRQIILQQVPANAAVIYVGTDASVSATTHGASLDPTQATARDALTLGPFSTGPLKLSDLYVLGSNAERLAILGVPF